MHDTYALPDFAIGSIMHAHAQLLKTECTGWSELAPSIQDKVAGEILETFPNIAAAATAPAEREEARKDALKKIKLGGFSSMSLIVYH